MSAIDQRTCQIQIGCGQRTSPIIYVINSPEHPFDVKPLAQRLTSTLCTIPVADWNDNLTPWPAAGVYRGEPDFGGLAPETLTELTGDVIPSLEASYELAPTSRAICGYSLGGLFALYALTHCDAFAACACLSGSVWYEGWVEDLREHTPQLTGRFAFLSIGTKERKAARPILKTVQDRMEACAKILEEHGCEVTYRTGPGNHFQNIPLRFEAGLCALDEFLCR